MNERFDHLRLDAGISRLVGHPGLVVINEEGNFIDPLIGLQKFAELIVKECLDILDDEDDGDHDGRSVRIAGMRIKTLFGVEE